jgi:hypothetical protein
MAFGINIRGILVGIILFTLSYTGFIFMAKILPPIYARGVAWAIDPSILSIVATTITLTNYSLLLSGLIACIYILISGLGIDSADDIVEGML